MAGRLRRYIEIQRDLGKATPAIVADLPLTAAHYVRRRRHPGSQIQGYGRFDLPLLAAYSRSGTNWIRYAIEWISQRPTPGQVRIHPGSDFVVDRAHQAYVNMPRYDSVLMVIRDYRECLLRHLPREWEKAQGSVEAFLDTTGPLIQSPNWYVENVRAFDVHEGQKKLIYYEDMQESPESVIREIAAFLDLSPERTDLFLQDLDRRYQRSVNAYVAGGHSSESTSDTSAASSPKAFHTARLLTAEQASDFDRYYQERFPGVFERYLSRYATT